MILQAQNTSSVQSSQHEGSSDSQQGELTTVVFGCFAFACFVILNSFERLPCLPVGRIGSSMVSSLLMIMSGVVHTEKVLPMLGQNLPLLTLVWGTMVLSHKLQQHGRLLVGIDKVCTWRSNGPWDTCWRLSVATSMVSAFIGWDIAALMLAPLAVKIAQRFPRPSAKPFLSAVATGANAGSILAPISNPGNIIVTLASGIPFQTFARKMILPWLLAMILNATCVVAMYAKVLFSKAEQEDRAHANNSASLPPTRLEKEMAGTAANGGVLPREQPIPAQISSGILDCETVIGSVTEDLSQTQRQEGSIASQVESVSVVAEAPRLCSSLRGLATQHWRGLLAYAVLVGCTVFWYLGIEVGAVSMCGAIILIAAEWQESGEPIASSADWPVIVYIAGILITIPGFNATGVPDSFWKLLTDKELVSMVSPVGILALTAVITFSTNIVTNVPAVLLLAPRVAQLAKEAGGVEAAEEAWLFVAFTAACAGSLTVQGSITQVIAYSHGKDTEGGSVSFLEHLWVGVPITVLTLGLGLPLLLSEFSVWK